MGLNQTPVSERVHIGFFGKRNAGKSSVMNAVTGQDLAVVSEVKGTTTDPVYKSMELLPMGPVVMIDTAGIDDKGELGQLRVRKSSQVLNKTDIAILVADGTEGLQKEDLVFLGKIRKKNIPCLIVLNKADRLTEEEKSVQSRAAQAAVRNAVREEEAAETAAKAETATAETAAKAEAAMAENRQPDEPETVWVSALEKTGIHELKEKIAGLSRKEGDGRRIVGDLLSPSDLVVLVVPIDKAAPKGRLILPQQQTIRDILDADASAVVVKETGLKEMLKTLGKKPRLVITDSQVFEQVAADTPEDIPLTSFSILFARYKGNLETAVKGAEALDQLKDGDRVLISEGCTHHRQCDDIGSVKLPRWIQQHTGKELIFEWTSGTEFPEDLSGYGLIVHCGGCMLNEREMKYRLSCARDQGIPITNYGILIASMRGILKRSIELFG